MCVEDVTGLYNGLLFNPAKMKQSYNWYQNQQPWLILNGHYALCYIIYIFGAHHKNVAKAAEYLALGSAMHENIVTSSSSFKVGVLVLLCDKLLGITVDLAVAMDQHVTNITCNCSHHMCCAAYSTTADNRVTQ